MSDTSDYTIVDDSSSSGQVQVQVQVQAPATMSMSSPSPGSHKIMGHAVHEISEVLQLIRNSIIALYEALLVHLQDDGWPKEVAKDYAASNTEQLVDVLEFLGKTVALLPEQGYVETAELLIEILDEASSMLTADGEKVPDDALYAQSEVLTHKCLAQAQLRASHSRYPAQAAMLQRPVLKEAISNALNLHSFVNRDAVRSVANIFHALLPTYMRSLTAIYGSASGVSSEYIQYAKFVVSQLDKGNQDAVSEKTEKIEGAERKTKGSQDDERHTTWYGTLSGWQVRAWCSSFWR